MTAYVHLPEPVLRLDEPLGAEQVFVAVRVDLRDSVVVALDLDLALEAFELDGPGGLRERGAHRADAPPRAVSDTRDKRQHQDDHEQAGASPLLLLGEEAVVLAGIAVLRGAGWSWSAGATIGAASDGPGRGIRKAAPGPEQTISQVKETLKIR